MRSLRGRKMLIAVLALIALWVAFAGRLLVRSQDPQDPEALFVLSGDRFGERLQKGAEVAKSNSGPLLVFLRAGEIYDPRKDAATYIRDLGVADERVRFLPAGNSTAEEAGIAAGVISRCKWKEVGVVTSPYHTRRAGWLFRRAVGDAAQMRTIASKEPFNAGKWWGDERDAEVMMLEWVKGVNSARYIFRRPAAHDPGVPC